MTVESIVDKRTFETRLRDAGNAIADASDSTKNWEPSRLSKDVQLRSYQLQGLRWLGTMHNTGLNGILADEMGLGKTLQTIAFLSKIVKPDSKFLIVIPLSLVMNWNEEWKRFAPSVNVKTLMGSSSEREECIKSLRKEPFTVLTTTYESCLRESEFLASIPWDYLVVDEAQRLKNKESMLHRHLKSLNCKNSVLLTGIISLLLKLMEFH